ncbi:MAG TPA: SUMF1/EgtB/PvdO family nonheme iron enzyme, partial [Nitrospiraceae bacterium]|nr:SUMF1/EgtB/PvdO family nonheme iron enzyme [Nitrospiraceae bacterium]
MMWACKMMTVVLIGMALLCSVDINAAFATEAAPTKPESVQAPTPSAPSVSAPTTTRPKSPAKSQSSANGPGASKPGGLPQPPAQLIGKDGAPMVLIPAGEFTMGSDKGDDDEEPIHRLFLDSFYMDKFEVTNGRFAKF